MPKLTSAQRAKVRSLIEDEGNTRAEAVARVLAFEPAVGESRCACGEEVNEHNAGFIADAGYPEHAKKCWECIPEGDAAAIRRINRGAA